jgi:hypothetical protein
MDGIADMAGCLSQDLADAGAEIARLRAENERLRAALRDIADPFEMLRRRAEAEGAKLHGAQALGYASHAPNLSALARAALDAAP